MQLPDRLSVATRTWFHETWTTPTRAQSAAWPAILEGDHTLVIAPTGSGKTLAAFLCGIDAALGLPSDAAPGVRVLYVSPLKALAVDVERNLRAPLIGITRAAQRLGLPARAARVDVRTGDTRSADRTRQRKQPAEILVTTPESLYLMLTSSARDALVHTRMVIVDEVHALAGTKRGVHLQLSLERLDALCGGRLQRIGLSATIRPPEVAARFLAGARPVRVVDTSEPPRLDLVVSVPVEDMTAPPLPELARAARDAGVDAFSPGGALGAEAFPGFPDATGQASFQYPTNQPRGGMWPATHPVLLELIRAHRSTLIFANSRLLCERLCRALNELAGEALARAHHGSVSHEQRAIIEEQLKAGELPAIIATSSLELGIDMGAIDLVVLVESPGSVSSGLQRVGRAGHQVGATSSGRIMPKHRGDLLESAVIAERMIAGEIEHTRLPQSCLDVLAQQIVAMVVERDRDVTELLTLVRRAGSYTNLTRSALDAVLDMLTGRYTSEAFADLRPSLVWDRLTDRLSARRGARLLAVLNGGTIPDRGNYRVRNGRGGPRVGELDEEMVYESRVGDVIVLGATTWRIDDIGRDEVIVSPLPGRTGRLPFWRGESPGRPIELGRALGAFLREIAAQAEPAREAFIRGRAPLDELAARNLANYVGEQLEAAGAIPHDRQIVVERFRDELGDWRICVLSPFGARVHAPWAMCVEAALARQLGREVHAIWSDDGIALRLPDGFDLPEVDALFVDPDEIEEALLGVLRQSAVFSGRFRENAARALLTPRKSATGRTPLWQQRRRAEALLGAVAELPSFPIVLETFRELLQDVFDLPALTELLRGVRDRSVRVVVANTSRASPFSRSLVFQYVSAWMYEGDQPAAERRIAALTLDRDLLAELLGRDALRDLLDPAAIAEVEAEVSGLHPDQLVDHPDTLHDRLRRLGDLSHAELVARCDHAVDAHIDALVHARRALWVRVVGEARLIAIEDAGRYRDALGVPIPGGVPAVFLEPTDHPVESIVRRFARGRGPFYAATLAARYGWALAQARLVLGAIASDGSIVRGAFTPGDDAAEMEGVADGSIVVTADAAPPSDTQQWCDADVLRRIKRRTLAVLRREVEAVDPTVFAAFLPAWHGIDAGRGGAGRLAEVLSQLEGLPVPFSELEARILPARIKDYTASLLDQAGATGEIVWVGHSALGARDGRVALYRREQLPLLWEPHAPPAPPPRPSRGGRPGRAQTAAHAAAPNEADAADAPRPTAAWASDPVAVALLAQLDRRGACFYTELVSAAGGDARACQAALWDLVWAGEVTNDTLQPLRTLLAGQAGTARLAGGRWSRVGPMVDPGPLTPAVELARAHARVMSLLERYGVLCSNVAEIEDIPGGWSAIYPVLRALEEAGRIRRGWFVDGLGGAQFALPGAVDRLRAARPAAGVRWWSAVDPALAWGGWLPWPARLAEEARPRRVAGARVAVDANGPIVWLSSGHLILFDGALDGDRLVDAITALRAQVGWRSLHVDRVDGGDPRTSPRLGRLLAAGFQQDYKGLLLSRGPADASA